jgi:malate dehydrogenase (oxaloacetate-decarboxylating)
MQSQRIRAQMTRDGLAEALATRQIWIVDLPGLLTDDMGEHLLDYQRPYARPAAEAAGWAKTPVQVDPSTVQRWPQMAAVQAAVRDAGGDASVVIDSDDLVARPEATMAAYCAAVGLPFIPRALT